jgi:putative SOS response-associated peptidase YedK
MRDALPMAQMELSFICSWVFFRVTPKDRGSAPPKLKSLLSTVLTTTPHDSLGHVHHRGFTGLHPRGMFADRLDPGPRTKAVQELLHSLPEPVLTLAGGQRPVDSLRHNVRERVQPARDGWVFELLLKNPAEGRA